MYQLLLYIGLVSALLSGTAGMEPAPNAGPELIFLSGDSTSCTIPFTRAGNLIIVKARVDTTEGNFILDTGAPNLVLNITYFRDYPITQNHDEEQTSIAGSTPTTSKTKVKSFNLGTLDYNNLEADLTDLGHIENVKGLKVLGLLGLELFRQCEMIIDYEQSLIYLHRIGKKEAKQYQHVMLNESAAYKTLPIELSNNRIFLNTTMEGKKLKFVVDCAAESNVLDSRLPNKILDNVTITKRVVLMGSNNRKVDALYGDLQKLKIDGEEVGNLPVLVTNLEETCFSYSGCVDGVLGFDFLSLHKVGFNFVKRKMYIWK
jgi:predicted aspartyl protease